VHVYPIVAAVVWGTACGLLLPRTAHRLAVPHGEPWSALCPSGHPLPTGPRGWFGPVRCADCRAVGGRYGTGLVIAGLCAALCASLAAVTGALTGPATGFGTGHAVLLAAAAGACALIGLRVASYDWPSRFVHFTAGVALPLTAAAPVVYALGVALT